MLGTNDGLLDGLILELRDGREDGAALGTNDGLLNGKIHIHIIVRHFLCS